MKNEIKKLIEFNQFYFKSFYQFYFNIYITLIKVKLLNVIWYIFISFEYKYSIYFTEGVIRWKVSKKIIYL